MYRTTTVTQCSYSHDVSTKHFPDLSDTWRCPHEVIDGEDQCIFHLPLDHSQKPEATTRLLAVLRGRSETADSVDQRNSFRFIGAKFRGIELDYEVIENTKTYPIDLRDAIVEDTISLAHAHIRPEIWLDGARIRGGIDGTAAQFEAGMSVTHASIRGGVHFRDVQFEHRLSLTGSTVSGDTRLQYGNFDSGIRARETIFRGPVILHGASIDADVQFSESRFESVANLERITVADDAIFDRVTLAQGIRLRQASMEAETTFTDTNIQGTAVFTKSSFDGNADFRTTRFGDRIDFTQVSFRDVSFSNASFRAPVRFDGATARSASSERCRFGSNVSLEGIQISEQAIFDGVTPPTSMVFSRARFGGSLSFEDLRAGQEATLLDFSRATISRGTFAPKTESQMLFDFSRATIGDVEFETPTSTEHISNPFDRYRFVRTEFDGFDFSEYSDVLKKAEWRLHGTSSSDFENEWFEKPDYDDLEKTYLKAKNGAETVGATQAEAEFFRKKLIFRRKDYRRRMQTAPLKQKFRLFFPWVSNWMFNLSSGYGERPRNTIIASVVTILLFAGLFSGFLSEPPYGGTAFDYLFLSIESFVSMIIGTPTIESSLVRVLAQFQGFLGGFYIALFVFALTRSLYR